MTQGRGTLCLSHSWLIGVTEQPAVLANVGESLLMIPEPVPSDQVPAAPYAAPPPPGQQTVTVSVHQEEQQIGTAEEQQAGDIPQPLTQELSKFSIFF